MKNRIRVGMIGIGHAHAAGKMNAVRKYPDMFDVVGYAEENELSLHNNASLDVYNGLKKMSVSEITENCDAVLVETNVNNLCSYAKKCVDNGKHVHMDKPASGTLEDYKYILDTAKAKGLVFQLGYMYRYNNAVKKCLQLVSDGKLGQINSINAEMSTHLYPGSKQALVNYKSAGMYIYGSHHIDLIVQILGEPKKVTVFNKSVGLDNISLDDISLAVLEYEKAIARVFVSFVQVNGWGERQLTVSGSKGTVAIKPLENETFMTFSDLNIASHAYDDMKIPVAVEDIPKECRYDEMMKSFYSYIVKEKQNPFTYEHDYTVQKVLTEIIGKSTIGR